MVWEAWSDLRAWVWYNNSLLLLWGRKEKSVGERWMVDPKSGKVLMGNGHFAEKHDGKPGLHQFSTIVAIPTHICPFWYTTTLFRFVKNTPKGATICEHIAAKTGQKYAFSMLKSASAQKKYTTAGCVVVTKVSYEHRKGLKGKLPLHEQNLRYINRRSPQTPVKFGLQT